MKHQSFRGLFIKKTKYDDSFVLFLLLFASPLGMNNGEID